MLWWTPRKPKFAKFHWASLISNCANLSLDYGEVLTKGKDGDQAVFPLWEDTAADGISRKGGWSHIWAAAKELCAAFWKAAKPELWNATAFLELKNIIHLSVFVCKKTQTNRTLISFWIGATTSIKKHKGEKFLRNKTATSEGL